MAANQYTDYVLDNLRHINPYKNTKTEQYMYATGFLASFLGELIREDSRMLTKFRLACAQKYNQNKGRLE